MGTFVMILIALAAVGFVVTPLLRKDAEDANTLDDAPEGKASLVRNDPTSIEREVRRYRAAVRAGTICPRCAQANPDGSRYCYECGRRIDSRKTAVLPGNVTA